jgi:hypothetical protein
VLDLGRAKDSVDPVPQNVDGDVGDTRLLSRAADRHERPNVE